MSIHRSISVWGVWYLQRMSTPKNEVLRLKTLDFWRLSEDFESEEIGVTLKTWIFMQGSWSVKTSVFVVSFSLSWVIGNTVLLKGGRGNTKEKFPCDAQLKILHLPIPSSEAIGNLIQFSQFLQWQRRSSSGRWWICSDWGVRNLSVRITYTVRNMIALRNLRVKFPTVAVLRASCPKISYPPNGHIIEGHLCLIMLGCSLGYK